MILQFPLPPSPGPEHVPSILELWFSLFVLCWIFSGLLLLILPENWRDAVLEAAFPFLPPKDRVRPRE